MLYTSDEIGGTWLSCSLLVHATPSLSSDAGVQTATFVRQTDFYSLFQTWRNVSVSSRMAAKSVFFLMLIFFAIGLPLAALMRLSMSTM